MIFQDLGNMAFRAVSERLLRNGLYFFSKPKNYCFAIAVQRHLAKFNTAKNTVTLRSVTKYQKICKTRWICFLKPQY